MVACWIIFAVLLLFIPIGFGYFGVLCTKKFNPNEQQKKNMNLSLCKYIFLFWLYDLLFMAIFNRWRALIYVFGLLSIVIIFTNLIMANDTNKIKLLVLWDILCKNTDENHAMNSDEIREELAKRGISVMRKVVATDIAALNKYGYEVLSYKKKYYYYYVVSRPLETAEVVMLADVINAAKITSAQKKELIERLSGTLCSHQAQSISKHIIALDIAHSQAI